MEIRSLNDGIPVRIINRKLYKRETTYYYHYYNYGDRDSRRNGKENCKISSQKYNCYGSPGKKKNYKAGKDKGGKPRIDKGKKYKGKKPKIDKGKKPGKDKGKKPGKDKGKKPGKDKGKKVGKIGKKPKNKQPKQPNGNGNGDGNGNGYGNGYGNGNAPNGGSTSVPLFPTSSPLASVTPTSTYMSLPSETNENAKSQVSIAGIAVITTILIGVAVLVVLAVYRKRNNLRKGAVRLYDETDQNDSSVQPRYLSSISNMRSLRIPSMPPRVQLTRLSSATIRLPYKDNIRSSTPLNNNFDNNYLSPYTKAYNLSPEPNPFSSSDSSNQDLNSQKTDSVQSLQSPSSHESYASLESSFPIPPQRAFGDSYSATPTSATFGDMYN